MYVVEEERSALVVMMVIVFVPADNAIDCEAAAEVTLVPLTVAVMVEPKVAVTVIDVSVIGRKEK